MPNDARTYVAHFPYFYRDGKKFKANAFGSLDYPKASILHMVDNYKALSYIMEKCEVATKDLSFEVGEFVDARFAREKNFNGGVIEDKDRIENIYAISGWIESKGSDETPILEHKTFIVDISLLYRMLKSLGIEVTVCMNGEANNIYAMRVYKDKYINPESEEKLIK